jgi:hypothetical protein
VFGAGIVLIVIWALHAASSIFSASGFIDPIIAFDPSFDLTGFELQLSPGVGNSVAPVPLPAALPLLASGLGLMGWMRKRTAKKVLVN